MEGVLRRSSGRGGVVKEETRDQYTGEEAVVVKAGNKRPYHGNEDMKPSSPNKKDSSCNKQALRTHLERSSMEPDSIESSSSRKEQENRLVSARAEMGEVREENQRLKMHLNRIMKDYQILQLQFHDIIQKESNISTDTSNNKDQETEEPELVSLSLGRFSGYSKKNEKNKIPSEQYNIEHKNSEEGLNLGLECKFEAFKSDDNEPMTNARSRNSFEESKEEAKETLPPSKVLKTVRSGDDEISLLNNPAKKTRVSVRARCDTPTMNDGCQWRKYGQKIAKGNPCPRAYYRCTVAPSCPVRKQVQRCADDLSILITTYEGTHNHLLPMSATAMASTTSAAASMLLSGSSSSSRPGSGPLATISTSDNLHGLNLYLTDNTRSRQFYLPNASQSPSSFPTITLDLTSTPSSLSSNFDRFSSTYPLSYDPTSLNFGSSESNSMSWGNGFLGYGSHQPHIKNQIGTLNVGRTEPVENIYQSYMQKNPTTPPQQSLPANAIAAATKAITADPSFQSALAAALTSIIGNGSSGNGANQSGGPGGENLGQKLKRGETFQVASNYSTTTKGNGCASSYLNSSSTTSSRPVSSMFLPSSLPFSTSKSASTSAGDSREHTN